MTNVDLNPNNDLHLSDFPAQGNSSEPVSNINPRELSMDRVNVETLVKQPAVSLSGIAGISSVAETLKGSKPAAVPFDSTIEQIEMVSERDETEEVQTSGNQAFFIVVLILFLASLFTASYFLFKYFTA